MTLGPGRFPHWSPDGQRIAYVHNRQIWVTDGRQRRKLGGKGVSFIGGWKNGWILYVIAASEIAVMREDGSRTVDLTRSPATIERFPSFYPDGSKIAYTTYHNGYYEMQIADFVDSAGEKPRLENPRTLKALSYPGPSMSFEQARVYLGGYEAKGFSPDGKLLLFAGTYMHGGWHIHTYDLHTGTITRIFSVVPGDHPDNEHHEHWEFFPDMKNILVSSDRGYDENRMFAVVGEELGLLGAGRITTQIFTSIWPRRHTRMEPWVFSYPNPQAKAPIRLWTSTDDGTKYTRFEHPTISPDGQKVVGTTATIHYGTEHHETDEITVLAFKGCAVPQAVEFSKASFSSQAFAPVTDNPRVNQCWQGEGIASCGVVKQNCACYYEYSDSPLQGKARAEYYQFRWNGKVLDGYCETDNRLLRFKASMSCKVVDQARENASIDINFTTNRRFQPGGSIDIQTGHRRWREPVPFWRRGERNEGRE
jgi:Tol biopolymer transport system component